MHRLNNIILMIIAITIVSACGIKAPNSGMLGPKAATISPISNILQEEGGCVGNATPETTELLNEVEVFYGGVIEYIGRYNQLHIIDITPPFAIGTGDQLVATPLKPMVLKSDLLSNELKTLRSRFELNLGASFWSDESPPALIESPLDINRETRKLNALLVKARRLQALSCQRERLAKRKDRDIRAYYLYLKEPKTNSLCEELMSPSLCEMERLILSREGREHAFYSHYLMPFQKRFESFFKFTQKSSWRCEQREHVKVMEIPVKYDHKFSEKLNGSFVALNNFVSKKWSKEDFKISFVPYKQGVHKTKLEIKWSDSHLSFVNDEEPTVIYMSPFLNIDRLLITLAHELGHIFGFPDCYHEFYDQEDESIIYYALDETGKNLMCHLNPSAEIPKRYINSLKNTCQ